MPAWAHGNTLKLGGLNKMLRVGKIRGYSEIMTESGPKMVKKLNPGEKVWSLNEHTEELELKKITKIGVNAACDFWNVVCDLNKSVILSADGMLWTEDGWHELSCFRKGREIAIYTTANRKYKWFTKPRMTAYSCHEAAFSIYLEDEATNVMTADGVIIHI